MTEPIHLLSLGAGVQSSTMALMAAKGEILPMPTAAIFADTQDEPKAVYDWLEWLKPQLPFPIYQVTKGKLSSATLKMRTSAKGDLFSSTDIPVFTRNADGSIGKITNRGCTRDFKIVPIMQAVRKIAKVPRGCKTVRAIQWIGISLDEISRMKPSREAWSQNRWPLVDARMSRHDCLRWMQDNGYPTPPRSACIYCPYHNNAEWRRLRDEEPEAWQQAIAFEKLLQNTKSQSANFTTMPFLHRQAIPLDQVDLSTDTDRGQGLLWNEECEGMCGL